MRGKSLDGFWCDMGNTKVDGHWTWRVNFCKVKNWEIRFVVNCNEKGSLNVDRNICTASRLCLSTKRKTLRCEIESFTTFFFLLRSMWICATTLENLSLVAIQSHFIGVRCWLDDPFFFVVAIGIKERVECFDVEDRMFPFFSSPLLGAFLSVFCWWALGVGLKRKEHLKQGNRVRSLWNIDLTLKHEIVVQQLGACRSSWADITCLKGENHNVLNSCLLLCPFL